MSFECKQLADLDTLSKSDPQIIIYTKTDTNSNWTEIGKTEIVYDNLNPKFSKSIELDYFFEKVQPLKFVVLDVDDEKGKIQDQDMIGDVVTTLGNVVGSKGTFVGKIIHPKRKNNGFVIISAEEVQDLKQDVIFKLSATNLDKKDFFGKSDPFIEIYRPSNKDDGNWVMVHRTEYLLKTLNPVWKPFTIPLNKLNGGDMLRPLKFMVWDWNKNGKMDYIGEFTSDLQTMVAKKDFAFVNEKKKKSKGKYVDSGVLHVVDIQLIKQVTFLDYIAGGTEINLAVAIDYTASNGDPKYSSSLHYQNPYEPNDYARAIMTVGEILLAYDSDGNVPTFGFGAKMHNGVVSHCFNVSGLPQPEVRGVEGILQAYRSSFVNGVILSLHGPTNFAPVIKIASDAARALQVSQEDVQAYLILLIITDGEITDMDNTIAEIVEASYLPMSIVIVGVGPADFFKMELLDGDDGLLKTRNRTAERDIVQFVPFRDYKKAPPEALAAAVLAEIPEQFLQYMKKHKINPRPPPTQEQIAMMQQQAFMRNMSYIPQPAGPQPQQPPFQPTGQGYPQGQPYMTQQGQPYPGQPQPYPAYPQQQFTNQPPQHI
uniref:C2 domain-containing protein n=1 Tax=Arcella intermedia TaxID=1963864 RepID=A0A6B2L0E4_9EUKA